MVDPLSDFSFQPVLHNWFNKGCGMYYLVCCMVHVYKGSPAANRTKIASSFSRYRNGPSPCARRHVIVNKMC